MKRKFKMLFLPAVIVFAAIVCFAFSAGALDATGQCGDNVYWTFDEATGELVISGSGDTYNYWGGIGDESPFMGENIKKVVIKKGTTGLGSCLFESCKQLKSVVIPSTVKSIGEWTFSNCEKLSITIPETLEEIDDYAFSNCKAITKLVIPESVNYIGTNAFAGCSGVSEITLPDTTIHIYEWAFKDTGYYNNKNNWENGALYIGKHLIKVDESTKGTFKVKEGTATIANWAFINCVDMTDVKFPDSVLQIGSYAFGFCKGLTRIVLPEKITNILYETFEGCSNLKSVVIPEGVTLIGMASFLGCNVLEDVFFKGSEEQWSKIRIGFDNGVLLKVNIHFDYCEHQKITITKATLTKNGKIVKECSVCDKKITTKIYSPKTITLSKTSCTYSGKARKPSVTVKDSKGKILTDGKDYKVTYEKGRKLPGKYTVRIDFMGNYSGTKRLYFNIVPAKVSKVTTAQSVDAIRLTWDKVTGADGYRVYQYDSKTKKWNVIKTVTATTYRIEKLKSGTTYKFKIRAYKNDEGTILGVEGPAITAATKPATPKITKLTATKSKASLVWSNVDGESGYEVYCSTKKDSGFKKATTTKANAAKTTVSKLTSGKTCYFKVRAYKTVGDAKVYSAWSAVKALKVK